MRVAHGAPTKSKPQTWYIIAARNVVDIISLWAVYHRSSACIFLRFDDILVWKRDMLVFGRMISSHFVSDDIHFLWKWFDFQAFLLFSVIIASDELYFLAVIFGLRRVVFASRVLKANIISLRNGVERYHFCEAKISLSRSQHITKNFSTL